MAFTPIHVNRPGIVTLAIAFGVAIGGGALVGITAEGPLMMIAGPLCLVMDLGYRFSRPERGWFQPGAGGAMFFIPVWVFGIFWLVLGVVDTIQGRG